MVPAGNPVVRMNQSQAGELVPHAREVTMRLASQIATCETLAPGIGGVALATYSLHCASDARPNLSRFGSLPAKGNIQEWPPLWTPG